MGYWVCEGTGVSDLVREANSIRYEIPLVYNKENNRSKVIQALAIWLP